jgi:SAM-dependent methyltransferase
VWRGRTGQAPARGRLGGHRQLGRDAGTAPKPSCRADATRLPFADASFGSIALLYVLYHLPEPHRALAEAQRVLRAGGLVVVAAPSGHDSPGLARALRRPPLTFDAELAPPARRPALRRRRIERWDAPLLELPTQDAVRDYLVGKGIKRHVAETEAEAVAVPLTVTKRGALVFARQK